MSKLFKAELKKIFLRPGIFIMTALLAVILALSYFLYNPISKPSTQISISKESVSEIYDYFKNGDMDYSKANSLSYMDKSLALINNYYQSETDSKSITLKNKIITFNNELTIFIDRLGRVISSATLEGRDVAENQRITVLLPQIQEFRTMFNELTSNYSNPLILIKSVDYDKVNTAITNITRVLNLTTTPTKDTYTNMIKELNNYNISKNVNSYKLSITTEINSIKDVTFNDKYLDDIKSKYYDVALTRLNKIESDIDVFATANIGYLDKETSADVKDELNKIISFYYNSCRQMNNIISSKIYLDISKDYTDFEFSQLYGLKDFNRYQSEQSMIKQQYLFENNEMEYNYAVPFNFLTTSNIEANAYDFVYFVLELFSFIIIIYCVVLGSSMIAGEQNNGTLKLLAIRPYKRHKIMTSKLLATTFFAIIFTLLAMIITLVAGGIMFGMESLPILCVFNASSAIALSPLQLILIYFVTLIVRISVYIALAFAISTLFKSYVGAVTVSIFCFFATAILNIFVTSNNIIKFLPLNNLDLFKYLGGGMFPNSTTSNGIFNMFSTPILPDTSFFFSLISIVLTIGILMVLTYTIFKKRDIA